MKSRIHLSLFLLSAGWLLASCAGGGTALEARSIDEVTANEPLQVVDITDQDAVLQFESAIPLACSVIYGESTDYGTIATDQDMAGGAHSDHHPLLMGLKPDTTYHFRVQGTDANGNFYISRDMTFRTLEASGSAETNFASLDAGAQVVDVSSNFGGAANDERWGANGAIDGNRGSEWSSDGDGDDAYLTINLIQPIQLSAIEVWSRSMGDGTAQVLSFTITTDAGETFGPFQLNDAEGSHRFELATEAKQIRFDVEASTGGNTGLVEFAVYGTPIEG
jgi:hypothetical protein